METQAMYAMTTRELDDWGYRPTKQPTFLNEETLAQKYKAAAHWDDYLDKVKRSILYPEVLEGCRERKVYTHSTVIDRVWAELPDRQKQSYRLALHAVVNACVKHAFGAIEVVPSEERSSVPTPVILELKEAQRVLEAFGIAVTIEDLHKDWRWMPIELSADQVIDKLVLLHLERNADDHLEDREQKLRLQRDLHALGHYVTLAEIDHKWHALLLRPDSPLSQLEYFMKYLLDHKKNERVSTDQVVQTPSDRCAKPLSVDLAIVETIRDILRSLGAGASEELIRDAINKYDPDRAGLTHLEFSHYVSRRILEDMESAIPTADYAFKDRVYALYASRCQDMLMDRLMRFRVDELVDQYYTDSDMSPRAVATLIRRHQVSKEGTEEDEMKMTLRRVNVPVRSDDPMVRYCFPEQLIFELEARGYPIPTWVQWEKIFDERSHQPIDAVWDGTEARHYAKWVVRELLNQPWPGDPVKADVQPDEEAHKEEDYRSTFTSYAGAEVTFIINGEATPEAFSVKWSELFTPIKDRKPIQGCIDLMIYDRDSRALGAIRKQPFMAELKLVMVDEFGNASIREFYGVDFTHRDSVLSVDEIRSSERFYFEALSDSLYRVDLKTARDALYGADPDMPQYAAKKRCKAGCACQH